MSITSEKIAVRRGVVWLGGVMPDWYRRINLAKFNIDEPEDCILGQLYGDFWQALEDLNKDEDWAYMMGFASNEGENENLPRTTSDNLEVVWRAAVNDRMAVDVETGTNTPTGASAVLRNVSVVLKGVEITLPGDWTLDAISTLVTANS